MMKTIIKPTLVLTLISAVIAGLLAFTYNVAGIADLGKSISPDELKEYQQSVSPAATNLVFAKEAVVEDQAFLGAYKDEGGNGGAIHIVADGYGGKQTMKLLVGFDNDGVITGSYVIENAETPGLGSKALTTEFLGNFVGKTKDNISVAKSGADIDAVAGATISSASVGDAFLKASELFETVKGDLK